MKSIKSVFDKNFQITKDDYEYNYQTKLISKLDNASANFTQEIINEIVLWKVNRYADVDKHTLDLINEINVKSKKINIELTKEILMGLLGTKGIQLPMASSILRFKNKYIYQIIDQRVYRTLYKKIFLPKSSLSNRGKENNIHLYLKFLVDLKVECEKLKIPFSNSDRILYMVDKRINWSLKLKKY